MSIDKEKKLRIASSVLIIFTFVLVGFCIASLYIAKSELGVTRQEVMGSMYANVDLENFREASDYLTSQAREYVQTYDPIYMERYFEELEGFKRRETVIAKLSEGGASEVEVRLLQTALDKSDELVDTEVHCMKIVSTIIGYDEKLLPERVRAYELTSIEEQADIDTLKKIAYNLVYGDKYVKAKEEIMSYTERVSEFIRNNTNQKTTSSIDGTENAINLVVLYMVLLGVLIIITAVFAVITTSRQHKEMQEMQEQMMKILVKSMDEAINKVNTKPGVEVSKGNAE